MDAAGIAALITAGTTPPKGSADIGYHTGQIVSWDESSGTNVVQVQGVNLSNLKTLQGGIGILYQAGDVVGVFRFQTTYFVLGKVAAPGAGAANQIRSNRVQSLNSVPLGGGFAALSASPGPVLNNVYIGSSRRCLVVHSVEVSVFGTTTDAFATGTGYQGVAVSGASTMAVETAVTDAFLATRWAGQASVTATTLVTAANGLNSGFHTFTCLYKASADTGLLVDVNNRVLTVIPF